MESTGRRPETMNSMANPRNEGFAAKCPVADSERGHGDGSSRNRNRNRNPNPLPEFRTAAHRGPPGGDSPRLHRHPDQILQPDTLTPKSRPPAPLDGQKPRQLNLRNSHSRTPVTSPTNCNWAFGRELGIRGSHWSSWFLASDSSCRLSGRDVLPEDGWDSAPQALQSN